jgi:hypothetical protein
MTDSKLFNFKLNADRQKKKQLLQELPQLKGLPFSSIIERGLDLMLKHPELIDDFFTVEDKPLDKQLNERFKAIADWMGATTDQIGQLHEEIKSLKKQLTHEKEAKDFFSED